MRMRDSRCQIRWMKKYDLDGSEEENNISEIPRLMNMSYEVEATQFIQPPEMRQNGRNLHPSMLGLNWDYGIHLPENFDENELTASSDLFASSSSEKETMNCFVNEEVLIMNKNIGQEGLTRNQYSNIIDELSNHSESDYSQGEICMMVTEETSDTDTIMHSNKDLKKPPENNPWQVAKLPDHSQDPHVLALSCTRCGTSGTTNKICVICKNAHVIYGMSSNKRSPESNNE
jgi:hypothetical protein